MINFKVALLLNGNVPTATPYRVHTRKTGGFNVASCFACGHASYSHEFNDDCVVLLNTQPLLRRCSTNCSTHGRIASFRAQQSQRPMSNDLDSERVTCRPYILYPIKPCRGGAMDAEHKRDRHKLSPKHRHDVATSRPHYYHQATTSVIRSEGHFGASLPLPLVPTLKPN